MCLWLDLHTCVAQGCDRLARDPFDGHPFCDTCFGLLYEGTKAALLSAWQNAPTCMIGEPEIRQFVGPISKKLRTVYGPGTKQREIIDAEGWIKQRRRAEIQAAWTLRGIRRRQAMGCIPGGEVPL